MARQITKHCVYCEAPFECAWTSIKRFCSPKCSKTMAQRRYRRQRHDAQPWDKYKASEIGEGEQ